MKLIYLLLALGVFLPRVLADGLPDLGDASQAVLSPQQERRIGEFLKRDTLMFNGYGEQVASLYRGMDLRKFF